MIQYITSNDTGHKEFKNSHPEKFYYYIALIIHPCFVILQRGKEILSFSQLDKSAKITPKT